MRRGGFPPRPLEIWKDESANGITAAADYCPSELQQTEVLDVAASAADPRLPVVQDDLEPHV